MTKEVDVEQMVERIYTMFPTKHKPSEYCNNPLPIYSFERAATMFWGSMIEEMVKRGMNEEEIEYTLQSKQMRWMFDNNGNMFDELAKILVTPNMVETARNEVE